MKETQDTSRKTQDVMTGKPTKTMRTYKGYPIRVLPDLVEALDQIAGMHPGELYDLEDCPDCIAMIGIAAEALRKARGEE